MSSYPIRKTPGDTAWLRHDRFGMFIHWGLYAMPARHEWIKNRECITDEKYDVYFRHFNPDLYDARDWAKRAKELLAVPRDVMDTMENYTGDPAAVYRWRDAMADLLESPRPL